MMSMRQLLTVLVGSLLTGGMGFAPAFGAPTAGSSEPTLLGQFGAWGAYTASPNGKKVCFALAKPSSSKTNPPNRPRDPAYAFVSTRPAEKVVNEVSVTMGYPLKPGSEATLEVGGTSFEMYTQGDGIWIKNAAEEGRLIDAMRKSADATVKGVSSKGTHPTDVFSLNGLSQALDKVAQDLYPSNTMLDYIEEILEPDDIGAYAAVLLEKIADETYPSVSMMRRLVDLTAP